MARDKIKRAFIWMRNAMRIIEKTTLPGEISGEIRPIIDVFGWDRLQEPVFETATVTGGAATEVQLSVVPENEARLYLSADFFHTSVTAKDIRIVFRDRGGQGVSLSRTLGFPANFFGNLERPILVPAGSRLAAVSRTAIGALEDLTIAGMSYTLPIGEYVPFTPYG